MRIIVRGYGDGNLVLEERFEVNTPEELRPIAERRLEAIAAYELHMVEIERLEESDRRQRFMRFGTDPHGGKWCQAAGDFPDRTR